MSANHLRYLDQHPDAADRAERIAQMVPSTQPLVRLLAQRLARGNYDNSRDAGGTDPPLLRQQGSQTICESGTSPDATSSSPTGTT